MPSQFPSIKRVNQCQVSHTYTVCTFIPITIISRLTRPPRPQLCSPLTCDLITFLAMRCSSILFVCPNQRSTFLHSAFQHSFRVFETFYAPLHPHSVRTCHYPYFSSTSFPTHSLIILQVSYPFLFYTTMLKQLFLYTYSSMHPGPNLI